MPNGILNILKPVGMSSHDIVSYVRRTLGTKKVGHAGTLDPDAAGVLPVFVGNATRLIEYTADADKSYRVRMQLGIKTDTGDDSGTVIAHSDILPLSKEDISAALHNFEGVQQQIPPMYSAIKINGQKLYNLARKGIEVERLSREICISSLRLIQYYPDALLLDVTCSKGTYIRTLIEDIAENLDMVATMSFLLRTRVGAFELVDTCTLEQLANDKEQCLLPVDIAIRHLPKIQATANQGKRFMQGVTTTFKELEDLEQDTMVVVTSECDELLGIGQIRGMQIKPRKVFSIPQNN